MDMGVASGVGEWDGTEHAVEVGEVKAMNDTVSKIEQLLRLERAYALDMNFSRDFAYLTGRTETSVLRMVRELTKRREQEATGRGKYERAVRSAVESIWDWYNKSDEYREMSTEVALDMLESHEPECIWAVMLGQKKQTYGGTKR